MYDKSIDKPKVFISYARSDLPTVLHIHNFLRDNGCSPWMDIYDITPGQDWMLEIQKAIEGADFFVACLSKHSVSKRGYVQKELKIGLSILDQMPEGGIYIIPIRLEECPVPHSLSTRQWLDWFAPNAKGRLLKTMNVVSPRQEKGKEKAIPSPQEFLARQKEADKILREQGIEVLLSGLDEASKVELLYIYKGNKEGWIPSGYYSGKVLLYTDLVYLTKAGEQKRVQLNNYSQAMHYTLRYELGLGDDKYYVRPLFLDAFVLNP